MLKSVLETPRRQWVLTAEDLGSIPCQGMKIPQAAQRGQKKKYLKLVLPLSQAFWPLRSCFKTLGPTFSICKGGNCVLNSCSKTVAAV